MSKMTLALAGVVGLALAGCASAPWKPTRAAIEIAPPVCADFQVSLYFERDEARITREARSVLNSARAMARGCGVQKARVVGLADAVGAADVNMALSRRRVEAVTQALRKAGFAQVEFDTMVVGDAGATTGAGASAPLRRRADILFDLAAPAR